MFVFLAPFLAFSAFLLLLLVAISTPVVHSIWLFRLAANASVKLADASASAAVRFGVWGYCISAVDVSALGLHHDTPGSCSQAKLGYTFDSNVQNALKSTGVDPNAISKGLTAVLVLHPIACSFAFSFLLATLFFLFRRGRGVRRGLSFCILLQGLLAALTSTMLFLFDVILVAVVRSHIKSDTGGIITLGWGNGVWMVLGATIALWAAFVSACLHVLKGDKIRKKPETY